MERRLIRWPRDDHVIRSMNITDHMTVNLAESVDRVGLKFIKFLKSAAKI